jgi:acyl-coenzyme A synthetase/AMP-(fatty) acid ligase
MLGYALNREDLTKDDECRGVLRTGDRGHFDAAGYLYIDGRHGREIKLFGLRVNLEEVEAMLREHGPTAVVERAEGLAVFCEWGDSALHDRVRAELAAKLHLTPSAFQFRSLHPLPTTASGKIAYDQLRSLLK